MPPSSPTPKAPKPSPVKGKITKPRAPRSTATLEERCQTLDAALSLIKSGGSITQAWDEIGLRAGTTRVTLLRWYRKVRGLPRDQWPEALQARYTGRQATPIPTAAWDFFLDAYRATQPASHAKAYEAVSKEARRHRWVIPGEATFRRQLNATGARRDRNRERYL